MIAVPVPFAKTDQSPDIAAGNRYISLNIFSPSEGKHWRFYHTYLTGPPVVFPMGTRKSIVACNWRAIPYTIDPWQAGAGANNQIIWDHTNGD